MEQIIQSTKYIDPMVDVAFKLIFGTEKNKHLTKELLEQVFKVKIDSLSFVNVEHHGRHPEDRNAVFDLQCESKQLGQFLVEVQVKPQENFLDRALYYCSYPILEQAPVGKWDYSLKPVYFLGILDFKIPNTDPDTFVHRYSILDEETHVPMTSNIQFVFMEVEPFNKPYSECKTFEDKFLFFLKNLPTFAKKPDTHSEPYFEDLLKAAEYLKMDKPMRTEYDVRLKILRDNYSAEQYLIKHTLKEGMEKGVEKGKLEDAENMLAKGYPVQDIVEITGLPLEKIETLTQQQK